MCFQIFCAFFWGSTVQKGGLLEMTNDDEHIFFGYVPTTNQCPRFAVFEPSKVVQVAKSVD
jgi:hypothetical protein